MGQHNPMSMPCVPQDNGAPAWAGGIRVRRKPTGLPQAAVKVVVAPAPKHRLGSAPAKRDLTVLKLRCEVFVEWPDANDA